MSLSSFWNNHNLQYIWRHMIWHYCANPKTMNTLISDTIWPIRWMKKATIKSPKATKLITVTPLQPVVFFIFIRLAFPRNTRFQKLFWLQFSDWHSKGDFMISDHQFDQVDAGDEGIISLKLCKIIQWLYEILCWLGKWQNKQFVYIWSITKLTPLPSFCDSLWVPLLAFAFLS